MQWKGPHSRETITKAVVSLMIVLPIVLGIGWSSLIAAIWGLIFLPVGLILLVAAGFGLLFNYALVVSVWFNRRDELIVAGATYDPAQRHRSLALTMDAVRLEASAEAA
jgi:hypothetical protein